MDLFKECLPSILEKNEYLIETEDDEKSYSPYMVNKSLSAHIDCLLHANAMNTYHFLDKKMQYDYLFHSIRKYKRKYQKWMKFNETEDIQIVKEYYNCSLSKAKDYLMILNKDQIRELSEKLDKGGKS